MGKTNDVMMWSTVRQERKKEKKVKGNRCSTSHMSEGKLRGCLVHHFKKKKHVFSNKITDISTHFFIHIYFHTCFQTTKHMFLSACTKHPLV